MKINITATPENQHKSDFTYFSGEGDSMGKTLGWGRAPGDGTTTGVSTVDLYAMAGIGEGKGKPNGTTDN